MGPLKLRILALLLLPAAIASADPLFFEGFNRGDFCLWSSVAGGPTNTYSETFTGGDGSPWPSPWIETGNVALADLQSGQARFRPTPSGYSLARLDAAIDTRDVEVFFTVIFEDASTQGVGFYVRQNGGYLDQTAPTGQGYAVFVEGFRGTPGIGVWREVDGHESDIQILFDNALGFLDNTLYRVRFRVNQVDASTTLLQAKTWPVGQAEPNAWHVSVTDGTPELQGISGGIALDSWSSIQSPNAITTHTLVDDIVVTHLCNPLAGRGAVETISESFQFTEGPVWRGDHLLFSDIDANTIHRLDPPAGLSVFRSPSDQTNGLANDISGDLLAAEHAARRLSTTDDMGTVSNLVDLFQGQRFNSPNDIAVRSDGTVYFTDPSYGLADPGDRELAFNGLFRRTPGGVLTAEWQGTQGVNEPNGVVLSPDETLLYVTDTQAAELLVYDVAADGSLSGRRVLADSLTIPDGMCVDDHGNVYVATWASTVEVFTADGIPWGAVSIPRQATNCALGEDGGRALFVTAHEGLYRASMTLPGVP